MVQRDAGVPQKDEVQVEQTDERAPRAVVVHRLAGRVRFRVPARRGDRTFFEAAAARLAGIPSVTAVAINPTTGSIMLHHRDALEPILAQTSGLFDLRLEPDPEARRPTRKIRTVSPGSVGAAGFLALAALQLARGRLAGSAADSFWNAYATLRFLRRPGVAAALAAVGVIQLARGQVLSPAVSLAFYALNARRVFRTR